MTLYEPFSIVMVPFPFIDTPTRKMRPALVLSDMSFQIDNGALVLAMLTSAERSSWQGDVALRDWRDAGLRKPTILRWKIFTLESVFITGTRASLSPFDRLAVRSGFAVLFGAMPPQPKA